MFAHILTDVEDESVVRSQWESFTGESLSSYTITKTTLSKLTAEDWFYRKTLSIGRKNKQVVWIKADVNLQNVPDPLLKEMAGNVVFIRNGESTVLENS